MRVWIIKNLDNNKSVEVKQDMLKGVLAVLQMNSDRPRISMKLITK